MTTKIIHNNKTNLFQARFPFCIILDESSHHGRFLEGIVGDSFEGSNVFVWCRTRRVAQQQPKVEEFWVWWLYHVHSAHSESHTWKCETLLYSFLQLFCFITQTSGFPSGPWLCVPVECEFLAIVLVGQMSAILEFCISHKPLGECRFGWTVVSHCLHFW